MTDASHQAAALLTLGLSFADRDMLMRLMGGGIGHTHYTADTCTSRLEDNRDNDLPVDVECDGEDDSYIQAESMDAALQDMGPLDGEYHHSEAEDWDKSDSDLEDSDGHSQSGHEDVPEEMDGLGEGYVSP